MTAFDVSREGEIAVFKQPEDNGERRFLNIFLIEGLIWFRNPLRSQ
jgi:hypothetical protein